MGTMFSDINLTFIFLGQSPNIVEIKLNMNKGDLIKLTSFCTAKKTIKKKKRQSKEWEKIFANDAIDWGFKYTDHTIQQQQQQQKKKNPIKKWAENVNRHFSKEDMQMGHADGQ